MHMGHINTSIYALIDITIQPEVVDWIRIPEHGYWSKYYLYLWLLFHEVPDLYVIECGIRMRLHRVRSLWIEENNFLMKELDVNWIVRINMCVVEVYNGTVSKLIRIDLVMTSFLQTEIMG